MSRTLKCFATLFVGVCMMSGRQAWAQATYDVVSPSYLEITEVVGADIDEQFSGSATLTFGGTANLTVTGSTITFNSASLDAVAQGTELEPGYDGVSGDEVGDAGIIATLDAGWFDIVGPVALRDIEATATSGSLAISSGTFAASGVSLTLTGDSAADYRLESWLIDFIGGDPIDGASADNESTTGLIVSGTVLLPIHLELEFDVDGYPITVVLDGGLSLEP